MKKFIVVILLVLLVAAAPAATQGLTAKDLEGFSTIIRGAASPNLNRMGLQCSALANSFSVMDSLWYAVDRALEAAEAHSKIMCALCRL